MKLITIHKARLSKGFTLIELLIVVVIIAILATIAIRQFSGSTDSATAASIRNAGKELANSVGYLHANLGTGLSATANALPASGLNMMDVLMVGAPAVSPTYSSGYASAGMRPLESDFTVETRTSGTTSGSYSLLSFPVSFTACATGHVCTLFENVPTSVLQEMVKKFGIDSFSASTALSTSTSPIRYTAADAGGRHNVTLDVVP